MTDDEVRRAEAIVRRGDRAEIKALLEASRRKEDMVITNYDGERVWLRALFEGEKQIGITDCCLESDPCSWHAAVASSVMPWTAGAGWRDE